MGQGKKWSQMKDSEAFVFIGIMGIVILIFLLIIGLVSCTSNAQNTPQEEEKVYIEMSNGDKLELIADEYGNQYLKENAGSVYIYIPYPGETEDQSDTLHFYNAKNQ